jgi:hypothetical protein
LFIRKIIQIHGSTLSTCLLNCSCLIFVFVLRVNGQSNINEIYFKKLFPEVSRIVDLHAQIKQKLSTLSIKEQSDDDYNDKVTTFSCSSRTFKALFLLLNEAILSVNINSKTTSPNTKISAFCYVLNGLNRLKNKYNIVVVDADIKGVGDGVVDVKMTFIHP